MEATVTASTASDKSPPDAGAAKGGIAIEKEDEEEDDEDGEEVEAVEAASSPEKLAARDASARFFSLSRCSFSLSMFFCMTVSTRASRSIFPRALRTKDTTATRTHPFSVAFFANSSSARAGTSMTPAMVCTTAQDHENDDTGEAANEDKFAHEDEDEVAGDAAGAGAVAVADTDTDTDTGLALRRPTTGSGRKSCGGEYAASMCEEM
jgi:hypothetical protein